MYIYLIFIYKIGADEPPTEAAVLFTIRIVNKTDFLFLFYYKIK